MHWGIFLLKTKTPVKCFQEQHHCLHEDNRVLIIYSPWNIQDCWCGGEQEEVVICLWFYFQEGKALFLKRDYKGHFPVGWFFYYFFFFLKNSAFGIQSQTFFASELCHFFISTEKYCRVAHTGKVLFQLAVNFRESWTKKSVLLKLGKQFLLLSTAVIFALDLQFVIS